MAKPPSSAFSFLKFFEGVKPGLKRKQAPQSLSESEKKEKTKEYEKEKRRREFKSHWKVGRKWLCFDEEKLFSTYCKEFWGGKELKELAKNWVNGTHEITQKHKDALKAEKNKTNVRQSEAGKALRQLNKAEYDKMSLRFCSAHAIAKHDKSFKNYIWLCNLDEPRHIANVETEKTKSFLSKSLYFSITIDGAMDVAGDEQESIYLHSALKGVRQQCFLKFVSPESTS
ncbi:hypothetical protein KUTeg_008991 [Tegillarca granosa]|uniref:Uncharacterized protein n=1 Tax=Tegillarca granosa TaxID=220873 RepID=A0ABQ9FAS1_TEGGR|nr:hypothetical protein KUTeg_008991 [Tegillarca granosa]